MAKQTINIGTIANDGTGSTLRAAGDLINDNFNEIYTSFGDGSTLSSGFITATSTDIFQNKTIDSANNTLTLDMSEGTLTGTTAEFNTALSDGSFATLAGSEILTNKTIDTANNTISIVEADISDLQSYLTSSSTATLTNKTFDANGTGNSISNIEVADLASGVLDTDLTSVSASDDTLASAKAIKTYVDTIAAAGIHYHTAVRVESPTNLNAAYNNGTSGVGATLTNSGTLAAISIDGVTLSLNDRVLVYNQTNAAHNGIYYVSTVGDGATAWVLTRTTDTDSYGASDPNALGEGDAFFVKEGDTGAGELYVMNTSGTITFGTTNITFTVIAETAVYSAGTALTLTGTTFSVTPSSISSTQLTSAVSLQILDSSGTVVKTIYGAGS